MLFGVQTASLATAAASFQDRDAGETTYDATIRRARLTQRAIIRSGRYCSADQQQLAAIGREEGDQIRVRRNDDEYAVYTVLDIIDESDSSTVRMGRRGRQRLGTADRFDGIVDAAVPDPTLSVDEARDQDEFIEHLDDPGGDDLVISSAYGGSIAPRTDEQAALVADRLSAAEPTRWGCKGWNDEGSAFERWYVAPYNISPASFPALEDIYDREFALGISFRPLSRDEIHVGGRADESLLSDVAGAVESAVDGDVGVRIRGRDPGREADDRLISRLTAADGSGIWIGENATVRSEYAEPIAESVADVLEASL